MPGLLTLIGSGEVSAGMTRLHRHLLARLDTTPRIAFLDTPAGFELGAEAIATRFTEYFRQRFDLPVTAAVHRRADDDPQRLAAALQAVVSSNYLLAGPGSPTYAARHWRQSQVFRAVMDRWHDGAQLVFASSAAIALSAHVLPVYEIYKVGQELHWVEGLDLLGSQGFTLAIVTHWDNAEGGTHDTRACFMGMERFERLRAMLPPGVVVLGIDEHTACTLDLETGTAEVRGRGGVSILDGDQHLRHGHGEAFPVDELRYRVLRSPRAGGTTPIAAADDRARQVRDLLARGELVSGLQLLSENAPSDLAPLLALAVRSAQGMTRAAPPPEDLIRLLIDVRGALRAAKQWSLSDQVREGLSALGISLQDTPDGTIWSGA
jgi:hypothetical protein